MATLPSRQRRGGPAGHRPGDPGGASASAHPSKATAVRPGDEPNRARLRIFVCGFCSTAEMVPWCGQNPDCGHSECADALAQCAAPHRLDGRLFHGQVNVIMIERHLWDRYDKAADQFQASC